jgi:prepilin-type N-terminal cleavage/methylation domain-containing protein
MSASSRFSRRGFTLLEVLVSVGITALLAGFIVVIVGNVSGFWSRTSGRVSAEAQARFVLDQITTDLQGAVYRDDGNAWLAATILTSTANSGLWSTTGATTSALKPANGAGSLQGVATGNLADARFGIAGTWLRFFSLKRGDNRTLATSSAPTAVAYQIIRRATSGNEARSQDRRYLLHRTEVRPAAASTSLPGSFESGYAITASAYAPSSNSVRNADDPGAVKYPLINNVIAENVIDFGVRLYVRDATAADGLRRVFPATNTTSSYLARSPAGLPGATEPFPEVVDVMVRVLTDEGARLLAGYEASPQRVTAQAGRTAQQYWWDLALANSQVFTRRIVLNSRPL